MQTPHRITTDTALLWTEDEVLIMTEENIENFNYYRFSTRKAKL